MPTSGACPHSLSRPGHMSSCWMTRFGSRPVRRPTMWSLRWRGPLRGRTSPKPLPRCLTREATLGVVDDVEPVDLFLQLFEGGGDGLLVEPAEQGLVEALVLALRGRLVGRSEE